MKSFFDRDKTLETNIANGVTELGHLSTVLELVLRVDNLLKMSKDQERNGTYEVQDRDCLLTLLSDVAEYRGMVIAAHGEDSEMACKTCGQKKAVRPTVAKKDNLRKELGDLERKFQDKAGDVPPMIRFGKFSLE